MVTLILAVALGSLLALATASFAFLFTDVLDRTTPSNSRPSLLVVLLDAVPLDTTQ